MLKVEHLTCGYGGAPVVKDLSFEVPAGGRLCILGPNGCGKTTLLRALAGLLPHEGKVTAEGRDLAAMDRRQLARTVALLSQISSVYFSYTVYETVLMGRYAHQTGGAFSGPGPEDRAIALECMERTGVADLRDRQVTELSGGQLQRVFLARTFAQQPRIILLDEPTNHLDLKYQVELVQELRAWAAGEGRCVVGVLHDVNLALDLADLFLLMEDGQARYFGPAAEFDPAALNRVYQMDVGGYMRRSLQRWEELE
ncbi:MAG TPA: ABC transporter ATP-binding protein [Candidatus Fournierella excrementavium]|nr:ABC transporter ATP-binding protein [Candidatus Fournierella excrementavium]